MSVYAGRPASSLKFRNILYTKGNYGRPVTINRPEVTTLSFRHITRSGCCVRDASWDDKVAVVVLTGAGSKAFCTGADVSEWAKDFMDRPSDFYKWMGVFIETFERLRNIGKPTIARINGMVVGGGNELQMSCDLAVAAQDTFIRHVASPAAACLRQAPPMASAYYRRQEGTEIADAL